MSEPPCGETPGAVRRLPGTDWVELLLGDARLVLRAAERLRALPGSSKRLPDPGQNSFVTGVSPRKHSHDKFVCGRGLDRQLPAVQAQEGIRDEKRDALVAVDERVVQEQGFKQRRSHFGNVIVIAGLRPEQRTLEKAPVANALATAESLDQPFVDGYRFFNG